MRIVFPIPVASIKPMVLPIRGTAQAGFPLPSQDYTEPSIDLAEWLDISSPAAFLFRVSGSSMFDAGLYDGDIVVVQRGKRPTNGSIVVAAIDDGFVIRQLVVRAGVAVFESRNADNPARPLPADDVEIFGVVTASVRKYGR